MGTASSTFLLTWWRIQQIRPGFYKVFVRYSNKPPVELVREPVPTRARVTMSIPSDEVCSFQSALKAREGYEKLQHQLAVASGNGFKLTHEATLTGFGG
jgi:hypothetical protein